MLHVRMVEIRSIATTSRDVTEGLHQKPTQYRSFRLRKHNLDCSLTKETDHGTSSKSY